MEGWAEMYYRTEADREAENKVLPYAVNCKEQKSTPSLMTSFLVNLEFKKYYKIPYPVHFSCVGDRVYSIEEFIEEVLTAII